MNGPNLVAYAAQLAIIVLGCAGLPRVLGLRSPGVQYAFWRTLLVVCIVLPIAQPWQPGQMVFVPAPHPGPAVISSGTTGPPPAVIAPPSRIDWLAAAQVAIAIGIAARLAWIGLGMVRLRRMRRRAVEAATGFEDLQDAISAKAPIFWSAEARHPVTFGVLRPVVLLPAALKTADPAAQRAVVAHELHHVKRRDWGWVVAEELVRSAFWFHPAMWWLVSRVQLARETVVDELSILATNARRTYLDTLMAFADDTGLVSPPAFSARRHLFHRIMLLSKEGEMSSMRVAIGSCVLVLMLGAGTWGAVRAFPLYGSPQDQNPARDRPQPRRINVDFDDADLRTVLRIFATESGMDFVIDSEIQGRVNAHLHDMPWDQALREILRSNRLEYTIAGSVLRIVPMAPPPPPPPAPASRLMEVRPDGVPPPPPPPPSSNMVFVAAPDQTPARTEEWARFQALVDQYKPTRIGGTIKAPMKIRDVKPEYLPIARDARVQGVVIIEAILDEGGSVVAARVLRSIPLLDQAALSAVKQWQFMPVLVNGVPQPAMMTVTVNFMLPPQ